MNIHEQVWRLVPNIGALQQKIVLASLANDEQRRKAAYSLEQLPYCLGAALASVVEAVRIQSELVENLDKSRFRPNTEYSVPDDERDRIAYCVDAFFESAVRAQNAVIRYLQGAFRGSLPSSFKELIDRLEADRLSISAQIDRDLCGYWASSGSRVRAYRDLSQHFVVLPSNARILITGGQVEGFFMPLPHNPETKKPLELLYNNDSPNALPYMLDAFAELAVMLRAVIRELLGTDVRAPRSVSTHMFKEGGIGWPARHATILSEAAVLARLRDVAGDG